MPVSQDGPTPPVAHWTRTQDRFGTVLETSDMTFQQVDQFLTGAFGKPNEAGNTAEGQMQWVIPAKVAGVSIWYSKKGDGVKISVLKPLHVPENVAK